MVAIMGKRGGYIQLSPSHQVVGYSQVSTTFLNAALAWATCLEAQPTIARCYWITLSEAVKQLHIHLFPRYTDETKIVGISLFEARNTLPQPDWTPSLTEALQQWASTHGVAIIATEG
jgi:hypothetical protein